MLPQTGERQVAESIEGIKPNHRERYQYAINAIVEKHGSDAELNILDAACGIGYGTMMLSEAFPNATVMGVDVFADAVEAANRAYKRDNNSFAVMDLDNQDQWPYDANEFDAIVSIETIEHVTDEHNLIARYAYASPLLIGSVPNQDIVPFDKNVHPFHYRHYTKAEFDELLNKYGYVVEQWSTQYDKIPGTVYDADDGMGFIVTAVRLSQQ